MSQVSRGSRFRPSEGSSLLESAAQPDRDGTPSANALAEMLDKADFIKFLEGMREFESLDTTGENPADNERIKNIFEAYRKLPSVVAELGKLWQGKAETRQVNIPAEKLKLIHDQLLAEIAEGRIEVVAQMDAQIAEYKLLPEKIQARKKQISEIESADGGRYQLIQKRDELREVAAERGEKLENLENVDQARDLIGQNREVLSEARELAESISTTVTSQRLEGVFRMAKNNTEPLLQVLENPEVSNAMKKIKGLRKLGNPAELVAQIRADQRDSSAEAIGRTLENIQRLEKISEHPKIKEIISKVYSRPENAAAIEALAEDPELRERNNRNQKIAEGCQLLLNGLGGKKLDQLSSSAEQLQNFLESTQTLLETLGNSPAGRQLRALLEPLSEAVSEMNTFGNQTLAEAATIKSIGGFKPRLAIREFFIKHGRKEVQKHRKAVRGADRADKQLAKLEDAHLEKQQLEDRHRQAREAIFKNFPAAEQILESIREQTQEKFAALVSDSAPAEKHFESVQYWRKLITADEIDDDGLDVTTWQTPGLSRLSGEARQNEVSRLEEVLRKNVVVKVAAKMAVDIKTALGPTNATRSLIQNSIDSARTALGYRVTSRPEYKKIEAAAVAKIYTDPTVSLAQRKILENLFPRLKNSARDMLAAA